MARLTVRPRPALVGLPPAGAPHDCWEYVAPVGSYAKDGRTWAEYECQVCGVTYVVQVDPIASAEVA
jgi:hypothetical protein